MEFPKISIVTPSFNQADYLERTIKSVLDQGYPNIEYIIIDGVSTDGSVEIIKKYEDQLSYWISEPDAGMYDAIQKGFDQSTGEIMTWINSDDELMPGSLFIVAEVFSKYENIDWITGNSCNINELDYIVHSESLEGISRFNYYLKKPGIIQQEGTFWGRDLWHTIGGSLNTNLKYAGDFDLWTKFIRNTNPVILQTSLGAFRIRNNNQLSVKHKTAYILEMETILQNMSIPKKDLRRFQRIKMLKRIFKLFPFLHWVRKMQLFYFKQFDYSKRLRYRRRSKSFE